MWLQQEGDREFGKDGTVISEILIKIGKQKDLKQWETGEAEQNLKKLNRSQFIRHDNEVRWKDRQIVEDKDKDI